MANGHLSIDPFEEWMLQPCSVDLQLGNELMWYQIVSPQTRTIPIDPLNPGSMEEQMVRYKLKEPFVLPSGKFCLATTLQTVSIGHELQAQINGKSTWGRYGLLVHATAGFIDPGFTGQITLEMFNIGDRPLVLTPHTPIAQLSFTMLLSPPNKLYGHKDLGSRYQGQEGTTPPKALNW